MSVCTQCDTQLPDESRFCPRCGTPVPGLATDALLASSASDPTGLLDRLRDALADEFRVLRELGRGGMGRVFLAQELALDRRVALKVLPPMFAEHREIVERFKREARTAGKLSHPNIVAVYQVSEREGFTFFTMPFISGPSLRQVLRGNSKPEFEQVRRYLREAADALGYAHAQGVIHRDVKPENMLLERTESGRLLLTDFGIAKALGAKTTLTRPGEMMGTPYYMSPEQCEEVGEIDGRSDQYSLGLVGYEMLAGKFPFSADSMAAIIYKHLHEDPEPLARVRPDAPQDLRRVVRRATQKDPEDRFPTMRAFLDALKPSSPVSLAAVTSPPAGTPDSTRRSGRSRRLRILAAILLVIGGAAGVALWQQQDRDGDSDAARAELTAPPDLGEGERLARGEPERRVDPSDDPVDAGPAVADTGAAESAQSRGPENRGLEADAGGANRVGEPADGGPGGSESEDSSSAAAADRGERDALRPDPDRTSPEPSATDTRDADAELRQAIEAARQEAEQARRRAVAAGADGAMPDRFREAAGLNTTGLGALRNGELERALEHFQAARERFEDLARRAGAAGRADEGGREERVTGDAVEVDTGTADLDRPEDTPAPPEEKTSSTDEIPEDAIGALIEMYRRAVEAEDRQALERVYGGSIPEQDAKLYEVWFRGAEDLRVNLDLRDLRIDGRTAVARISQTMDYRLSRTRERRNWADDDMRLHFQADSAGWRLLRVELR